MKYRVTGNLNHDNADYAVGDTVEMSEAQAAAIPWAVEAMPLPQPPKSEPPKSTK